MPGFCFESLVCIKRMARQPYHWLVIHDIVIGSRRLLLQPIENCEIVPMTGATASGKMGVVKMTQVNIGKGIELAVDLSKLNEAVLAHVVYIGLRNILMDSHAGVTADKSDNVEAESRAVAEKKLAAMYAGEVRSVGTRTGDPVKAESIRLATDQLKTAIRKSGKKVSEVDAKTLRDAAIALVERTPAIVELARKRVAESKSVDADLGDLIAGL